MDWVGPGPRPDFRNLDPDALRSILDDPNLVRTKVVALHCGYPYEKKLAAMAYQYANLYVDFSVPMFFHGNLEQILKTFLEFTPHQKLFYGSDAWHTPETFGYDAYLFRRVLKNVLLEFSERFDMSREEIKLLATRILSRNAEEFLKNQH